MTDDHLCFAGLPPERQLLALEVIIRAEPVLMDVLTRLRAEQLPDAWLVSGAIYNAVWNVLTGRPTLTGIKDVDIAYFDADDLSYEAEDWVIRRLADSLPDLPIPAEPRNQARVHLWYESRFGEPYPPLGRSTDMLTRFASKTHAVAAQLRDDDTMSIEAPFGLEPMFAFRIEPNYAMRNGDTHTTKGARAKSIWPELTVVPW